jgi:hypothetical protein
MEKDFGKRNDRFLFFFPNKKEKKRVPFYRFVGSWRDKVSFT